MPSPDSHLSATRMQWLARLAFGACFAAGSAVAAEESDAWQRVVEQTMAETCAIRGLPLRKPVDVRAMAQFFLADVLALGEQMFVRYHRKQTESRSFLCRPGSESLGRERNYQFVDHLKFHSFSFSHHRQAS